MDKQHASTLSSHHRIVIVGTSGSGKSTFARMYAQRTGLNHIQLDELHFGPNWQPKSNFEGLVDAATQQEKWIADGNYSKVRHLTWARATAIIWLDFPLPVVFFRAFSRTAKRVITREELYGGNRENWRFAFFHRDGIPWWTLRTHGRNKRQIPEVLANHPHLEVFRIKHPRKLKSLISPSADQSARD